MRGKGRGRGLRAKITWLSTWRGGEEGSLELGIRGGRERGKGVGECDDGEGGGGFEARLTSSLDPSLTDRQRVIPSQVRGEGEVVPNRPKAFAAASLAVTTRAKDATTRASQGDCARASDARACASTCRCT